MENPENIIAMVVIFAFSLLFKTVDFADDIFNKNRFNEIYTVIDCTNKKIWSDETHINIDTIKIHKDNINYTEIFGNGVIFIIGHNSKFKAVKVSNPEKLALWINKIICKYKENQYVIR